MDYLYLMLFAAVDAEPGTDDVQQALSGHRLEGSVRLERLVATSVASGNVCHRAPGV